jgi:hypothetical protein
MGRGMDFEFNIETNSSYYWSLFLSFKIEVFLNFKSNNMSI